MSAGRILGAVDVVFEKRPGGGSTALIDRPDGVQLRLTSYDRKYAVAHDPRALRRRTCVPAHRRPLGQHRSRRDAGQPHGRLRTAAPRPARPVGHCAEANAAEFGMAEVLAGVVHLGLDQDDRTITRALVDAWGVFRAGPCPFPAERALAAVAELRRIGDRWVALPTDGTLPVTWTVRRR